MINGPWDVDFDGDGVNGQDLVDLVLPVEHPLYGRRDKPSFSVIYVDMDGKPERLCLF